LTKARDYAIMRIRKRKGSFVCSIFLYSGTGFGSTGFQPPFSRRQACGGHATREWLHLEGGLKNGKE